MKKYMVYWIWDDVNGDDSPQTAEYDTIKDAVWHFDTLGAEKKWIFKLVTWKTEITDITE